MSFVVDASRSVTIDENREMFASYLLALQFCWIISAAIRAGKNRVKIPTLYQLRNHIA